jgi:hypothetical protein
MVARGEGADLCFTDPGYPIDLNVDAEAQAMAAVWVGKLDLARVMRSQQVKGERTRPHRPQLPDWLGLSTFAYPDPRRSSRRGVSRRVGIFASPP